MTEPSPSQPGPDPGDPRAWRERLAHALEGIADPATGAGLVAARRAAGLSRSADGTAGVILDLNGLDDQAADRLEAKVSARLAAVEGVKAVRVVTTRPRGAAASRVSPIPGVRRVVAVASGKGGVGKSTLAVMLALAARRAGWATGLLDADIHGPSAQILLGIRQRATATAAKKLVPVEASGLRVLGMGVLAAPDKAVAWRGPMVSGAFRTMAREALWGELDLLVVDMPPGTGDMQLTLADACRPAAALVVTTPQRLAVADAARAAHLFRTQDIPVHGILVNMAELATPAGPAHPFGKVNREQLEAALQAPVLAMLPLDPALARAADEGAPPGEGPVAGAMDAVMAGLARALQL